MNRKQYLAIRDSIRTNGAKYALRTANDPQAREVFGRLISAPVDVLALKEALHRLFHDTQPRMRYLSIRELEQNRCWHGPKDQI